ncbi:hypothetical protein [Adhaeribacter pallidiroseus]|uniref:Uncharacterized protein n=1 Tax=Adhaeribacter pallidiroseus TaxID=2072847 RepID=A0A369QPR8_9BACT|nr:hypothetical protein [Adhaeribacter pallidiroseus]RDC66380.1 hypothetical protein AHMF7616_05011 [Adhaeribacter pallidiroseus]
MKMKFYLSLLLLVVSGPAFSQYKTVLFNYERAYFDDGQPLPAESKFIITGEASALVDIVEVKVYHSANTDKAPFYQNTWEHKANNPATSFTLPVNQPLRGNEEYTFLINYYAKISQEQQQQLVSQINTALGAYIDQSYQVERSGIAMLQHPRTMRNDLNAIVNQGLSLHRNIINYTFPGFSDLVYLKLKQLSEVNLQKARFNVFKQEDDNTKSVKLRYAQEQIAALKTLLNQEVAQYGGVQLYALTDSKKVADYNTEKTKNALALNVGYGGVYYSGSFDNLTYDASPYAGISIPFGKEPFASPFMARTSISTGVFLKNLDFGPGNEATGPVVRRPVYLALGYRILPFIRLNAGATVLQNKLNSSTNTDLNLDKVYIRPFVGLSMEVNLWLNLNR